MEDFINGLPPVLTVKDIMSIINVSKDTAYNLVHQKGFPRLPIKKPIRIPRDEFLKWAKIIN